MLPRFQNPSARRCLGAGDLAPRAIALDPSAKNAYTGPQHEDTLARIEAHFGDKGGAIAILHRLLITFYGPPVLTPALLRIDPDCDNLRGDPRFEKLCREPATARHARYPRESADPAGHRERAGSCPCGHRIRHHERPAAARNANVRQTAHARYPTGCFQRRALRPPGPFPGRTARPVSRAAVEPILAIIKSHDLDSWIYRGNDWFVRERHGPHVDREERTVKFPPTVVPDYTQLMDEVVKVVGISDDLEAVARCEADIVRQFSSHVLCEKTSPHRDHQPPAVFAARSQPYYVDVTHPEANKGAVVIALGKMLKIDPIEVATLGDMPNDTSMFESPVSASRWAKAAPT